LVSSRIPRHIPPLIQKNRLEERPFLAKAPFVFYPADIAALLILASSVLY